MAWGILHILQQKTSEKNIGIRDSILEYILKKRPYLQAGNYIHSKMVEMGLIKSPYIETTLRMYASLAARFFYTFCKFGENEVLQNAVVPFR